MGTWSRGGRRWWLKTMVEVGTERFVDYDNVRTEGTLEVTWWMPSFTQTGDGGRDPVWFPEGHTLYVVAVEYFQHVELLNRVSVADSLRKWLQSLPSPSLSVTEKHPARPEQQQQEKPAGGALASSNNGSCSKPVHFGVVRLWRSEANCSWVVALCWEVHHWKDKGGGDTQSPNVLNSSVSIIWGQWPI